VPGGELANADFKLTFRAPGFIRRDLKLGLSLRRGVVPGARQERFALDIAILLTLGDEGPAQNEVPSGVFNPHQFSSRKVADRGRQGLLDILHLTGAADHRECGVPAK